MQITSHWFEISPRQICSRQPYRFPLYKPDTFMRVSNAQVRYLHRKLTKKGSKGDKFKVHRSGAGKNLESDRYCCSCHSTLFHWFLSPPSCSCLPTTTTAVLFRVLLLPLLLLLAFSGQINYIGRPYWSRLSITSSSLFGADTDDDEDQQTVH